MKKTFYLMLAISSLAACQKAKNSPAANLSFNIPYSETTPLPGVPGYNQGTDIPAGGTTMPFTPVKVYTNARQYLAQYRTDSANLVGVYLGDVTVVITTPGNHYFNFLDDIELYVCNGSQPDVMVAYYYGTPPYDSKSINLYMVPGVNLKKYLTGDSVTTRLNAYVNGVPAAGGELQLTGNFQVTANQTE